MNFQDDLRNNIDKYMYIGNNRYISKELYEKAMNDYMKNIIMDNTTVTRIDNIACYNENIINRVGGLFSIPEKPIKITKSNNSIPELRILRRLHDKFHIIDKKNLKRIIPRHYNNKSLFINMYHEVDYSDKTGIKECDDKFIGTIDVKELLDNYKDKAKYTIINYNDIDYMNTTSISTYGNSLCTTSVYREPPKMVVRG